MYCSWKKQYDRVNQTIIKALQRGQKLEDVQIGTQLYEELGTFNGSTFIDQGISDLSLFVP